MEGQLCGSKALWKGCFVAEKLCGSNALWKRCFLEGKFGGRDSLLVGMLCERDTSKNSCS